VIQAIAFNTVDDDWDENVRRLSVVYRLDINEFRGSRNLQLMVEQLSPRTMT
jgi:single-stranded-DNA-specific exonuclease